MKTTFRFNAWLLPLIALSSAMLPLSNYEDNDPIIYKLTGDASGGQEVPPVPALGTATLTGTYNADNNTLSYTIIWNGLSDIVTAAHFHGPALPGSNADPLYDLNITSNGVNGMANGSIVITDSTETNLLGGKIYYNLHTLLYSNGEIRGQVSTTIN